MSEISDRFQHILESIENDDRNKEDFTHSLSRVRMNQEGKVLLPGSDRFYNLSDYAMTQAFTRLGIPAKYGKKLYEERPDLVADQFNHWVNSDDRGVFVRTRQTVDGGMIRAFLSDKYAALDNRDMADALVRVIRHIPDTEVVNFHLGERRTHIRLSFPELTSDFGVTVGGQRDIVRVGIDIDNSEVGNSSLRVIPMVLRLVCTNGMRAWVTDGDVFEQRHIHLTRQELYGRMSRAIVQSISSGDEVLEIMRDSRAIPVEDPMKTIETLAKKQTYSQDLTDRLKTNFTIEPENNLYGVVNALTRTARDTENIEQRIEIEDFAGQLIRKPKLVA